MRTRFLAAALLLPGAAAAQTQRADPIPLHPGTVGLRVQVEEPGRPKIVTVLPGSPAQAAEVRYEAELRALDGRPVADWPSGKIQMALVGAIGSTVEVTTCRRARCRTARLRRVDESSPEPGYTEVVVSPRFVVHHRPGAAQRHQAVELARSAERRYAEVELPRDTEGRRAHVWLLPRGESGLRGLREPWATDAALDPRLDGDLERVFGYLAYGYPGRQEPGQGQTNWQREKGWLRNTHRNAAYALLAGDTSFGGHRQLREHYWTSTTTGAASSLQRYILERHGAERLRRFWQSDLPFDQAVAHALEVPTDSLMAGWLAYTLRIGPDPEAPLDPGVVTVTLAWGGVALLYGAWRLRRKEVG
jgi:hypothetical protein